MLVSFFFPLKKTGNLQQNFPLYKKTKGQNGENFPQK